jgi:hypothetical protein
VRPRTKNSRPPIAATSRAPHSRPDHRTVSLLEQVCHLAGKPSLISDLQRDAAAEGILAALDHHDSAALFDWMVRRFSFQGVSDVVAHEFMERHGSITWGQVQASLKNEPACPKLHGYWAFGQCGYNKGSQTCNKRNLFRHCPLPAYPLRNGRLNQLAYSLYFFIRDVAGGDFAGWLEWVIETSSAGGNGPDLARHALLDALRPLYGVSDKMLTMVFSDLLIAGAHAHPRWLDIGAGMIVVDTLVHNFLWRSGILHRHRAEHSFGPACYAQNGCASIIRAIARKLDARKFNSDFPANFPRFVQHAIWHYCAQDGVNICNGNRIVDDQSCDIAWCPARGACDRIVLRRPKASRDK